MPSPPVSAAAISLALALASLTLPSGPGYDQYAWLIWGRELSHFGLSVEGTGTSWKPLPAIVDALLAPLGHSAMYGWLVISRAGALFAVFMAFRLAWRLAPRGMRVLAGVVAAASLTLTGEWLRRNGVGNSEGLMVAFGVLSVDRHLDGRRGQAFALLVAAGLIRVEIWPFLAVYGVWLLWRTNGWRRVAVAIGALVGPVLWFGGDWLGSGHLTTAADRAINSSPGAPGSAPHPALAVLQEAYTMLPLPAWIAIVAGLLAALARRRLTPVVALAGCALAWTAIVAVMAERGYPGLPRFVFMASALDAVAAGVGAAALAGAIARGSRPASVGVATVAACAFAFGCIPNARLLPSEVAGIDQIADSDAGLWHSVNALGGASAVLGCGKPATPWYTATGLAWDLGIPPTAIQKHPLDLGQVEFQPTQSGGWRVSEARSCGLVAAKPA